jgi:hypothetical protein
MLTYKFKEEDSGDDYDNTYDVDSKSNNNLKFNDDED